MNSPSASPFRLLRSPVLICLLLAVATWAVYSPVRNYGFVDYDDPGYFSTNPHVQGGLTAPNIRWAFTSGEQANWHPLTWLSLMLDASLFGSGAAAPHVTNVLLHGANSILVFLLLLWSTDKLWRSAAVAMLFAIHPLHVESVAWVSERKDVLSGFFGLLTLLCYARYAQSVSPQRVEAATAPSPAAHRFWRSYGFALFFFACGLMSKPMLVTLPFVMLLMDYWPLQRLNASIPRLLVEKLPFMVLSAASCVVTFIVQHAGGAVTMLTSIPLPLRVANAFISYARYLAKIFLPVNLATPYPAPHFGPGFLVVLSVVLFAVLCLAAFRLREEFPFAFTGWFWFAGMLVPVIGLVQVGGAAMADRYAYLPGIGIFIMVSWGVREVCVKWPPRQGALLGFTAFLFFICALRARNQVSTWENDRSLFGHALSVTTNNYVASLDLGYWYSNNGDLGQALDCYHKAVQFSPDDPTALYDAGNALSRIGRWDEAIQDYRHALQITPNEPDILDNLGFALAQNNQLPEATQYFQAVLKLKPDSVGAHNNLATIFFVRGNYAEAAEQYSAALKLSPEDPRIIINLADTLVRLGQKAAAVQYYQRALELQPDNETVREKLEKLGQPIMN